MATAKKKISQDELRRLMNEQKKKLLNNIKKIESPLARYDKDGVLTCIICESVVRSAAVWSVHLNSKKHRENITRKAKRKKVPSPPISPPPTIKRPMPPPLPASNRPLKSILKNAPPAPKYAKVEEPSQAPETPMDVNGSDNSSSSEEEGGEVDAASDAIPEGFFDDPKQDAKVRNVEYKDPIEEEWEQFQKEIKEETSKAQQIISEDQEEATAERQIDEIDEQLRNWSRVVVLEKKKQEVVGVPASQSSACDRNDSETDEEEFEEFVDWRAKRSFHH